MIHFESKKEGDTTKVILSGKITFENTGQLREKLKEILKDNVSNLVFDMKEVSFIDSSGLGLLVSVKNTMIKKDGTFSLVNISETVRKIMKQTGLDRYFGIN